MADAPALARAFEAQLADLLPERVRPAGAVVADLVGEIDQAVALLDTPEALVRQTLRLARSAAAAGSDEAAAVVASLEQRQAGGDVRAGANLAFAHAVLGRRDAAFEALDGIQWEVPVLIGLRADPLLAELRADPRYPPLLQRLGAARQAANAGVR